MARENREQREQREERNDCSGNCSSLFVLVGVVNES
jgi:hypothetical protein